MTDGSNSLAGINVISFFDGIGCGMQALKDAGIAVNHYYAFEIDEHAKKIAKHNHPEIIHCGDVSRWQSKAINLSSIDLVLGGPTCQDLSRGSSTGDGLEGDRSALAYQLFHMIEYIRFLKGSSVKFLVENVSMKRQWRDIFDRELGVDGVKVNSSLLVPQSRQRYYWTSSTFELPAQAPVSLQDMLDDGYTDRMVSPCITATYHKGGNLRHYFMESRRQVVFSEPFSRKRFLDGETVEYRKLTVAECEKLQGLPVGYTQAGGDLGISNTQAYKCIGNGWTVPIIAHILKQL